jgi:hypothetical protein
MEIKDLRFCGLYNARSNALATAAGDVDRALDPPSPLAPQDHRRGIGLA